ncbi:DUF4352 domain-containing protein [Chengkuizengella axinellae]|uniref:DUF4352 domain-containing protein n=1 Tax=Chengkuizengella axinellae TaxID=3064388 RepID=A0ABT9IWC5_9BACL|nr:DUF4352 domain-containing protein [Chengkuizengella sp. 2205SS18-9]MDP5273671.1 DUF4352 domain-containing protein [Chengkuizengella sp. 2205SS18-9]
MIKKTFVLCIVIVSLSLSAGCSEEVLSMDEEVTMKDWSFAIDKDSDSNPVNGTEIIKIRKSSDFAQFSSGGAHFIVISLKLINKGNSPIEIDGSLFELIDGIGNEYEFYKPKESIKSLKINPSLHKSINLIYEVPNDIEQDISIRYDNSNKQLLIGEYHIFGDDTMF